jgi:hypothetical protein
VAAATLIIHLIPVAGLLHIFARSTDSIQGDTRSPIQALAIF